MKINILMMMRLRGIFWLMTMASTSIICISCGYESGLKFAQKRRLHMVLNKLPCIDRGLTWLMLLDVISQELTYLPKFVTGKNSSIYALKFHSHPICILSCIYPPNSMEWRALRAATLCKFTRRSRFVTLFIMLFRVFLCSHLYISQK